MGKKASAQHWQFWIDRGGTFTDIVARRSDGYIQTYKLLSENPEHYKDASLQGIRDVLGLKNDESLPLAEIESVKMGTTVATNSLLERKGERCVLLITKGFQDALRIAYQNRPKIFARQIILPKMLYEKVVEVEERLSAHGEVILPLNLKSLHADLESIIQDGIRSVAIVFMHAYRFPDHERQVVKLCRKMGFHQISVSHEVSPLMKIVSRGDTSLVDAYLTPLLRRYVDKVADELGKTRLFFMQSSGGLILAEHFQGRNSILSGPAGGVVGAVKTAEQAGYHNIIGFDMGGTSTDVSHYAGEFEREFETQVAGVRMRTPMMHIHTVAAGGGSLCTFDGSRFRVGPESAGADPGPASYRRGGALAITDCNLILGKIHPDYFPKVFGKEGNQSLDISVVREKFAKLSSQIKVNTDQNLSINQVASGFITIAVENMANAIKKISIQKGHDISNYTLCCFGGAAGQHACLVADALGVKQVLIHPYAGVLSAYGIGLADVRVIRDKSVELPLETSSFDEIDSLFEILMGQARDFVSEQMDVGGGKKGEGGGQKEEIEIFKKVHIRYEGTDTALLVDYGTIAEMTKHFEKEHKRRFGFMAEELDLIVEAVSVEGIGKSAIVPENFQSVKTKTAALVLGKTEIYSNGQYLQSSVFDRQELRYGHEILGPALIIESNSTTVVESEWQAVVTKDNNLVLKRVKNRPEIFAIGTKVDPIKLEIFNNLYMSIAEQMGVTLQNTTQSVNIKERLDFSCAIFDGSGSLVANAPHIPVHLGSMSDSVRSIVQARGQSIAPGDVFALNAPYNGGTHLPDVTIITPVFDKNGKKIIFFVASRGHHADIGGMTPGSMPPFSQTIEEEGVLIDNFQIVKEGKFCDKQVKELLATGLYPARNPKRNISDFKAQIAANEKGVQGIQKMIGEFSLETVQAYMKHVQANAEESVRRVIDKLSDGSFQIQTDHGAKIQVSIKVNKKTRSAIIDFTGTSQQCHNNFNAPKSVCRAAVLYVFRTLVDDDIPLNEGCLKPLEIHIPEECFLNPKYPAAVVAGNVETSQHITDALYGALNVMAASQGTMNNFTFGNDQYQYYETICGGSGAGSDYKGTDAVHTHMTNSRLTDPEVLEWRFPVRVNEFKIRTGSGGQGEQDGGDGVIRKIEFLQPMTASILSSHRDVAPFGLSGGGSALPGKNYVEKSGGDVISLKGCDEVEVDVGDVFVIETPGGGGFGE